MVLLAGMDVASGSFVREPNVYLVPIGIDCMRSPAGTDDRKVLGWSVVDQVLYDLDKANKLRFSHENPEVAALYKDYLEKPLSHKAHELLHTD